MSSLLTVAIVSESWSYRVLYAASSCVSSLFPAQKRDPQLDSDINLHITTQRTTRPAGKEKIFAHVLLLPVLARPVLQVVVELLLPGLYPVQGLLHLPGRALHHLLNARDELLEGVLLRGHVPEAHAPVGHVGGDGGAEGRPDALQLDFPLGGLHPGREEPGALPGRAAARAVGRGGAESLLLVGWGGGEGGARYQCFATSPFPGRTASDRGAAARLDPTSHILSKSNACGLSGAPSAPRASTSSTAVSTSARPTMSGSTSIFVSARSAAASTECTGRPNCTVVRAMFARQSSVTQAASP